MVCWTTLVLTPSLAQKYVRGLCMDTLADAFYPSYSPRISTQMVDAGWTASQWVKLQSLCKVYDWNFPQLWPSTAALLECPTCPMHPTTSQAPAGTSAFYFCQPYSEPRCIYNDGEIEVWESCTICGATLKWSEMSDGTYANNMHEGHILACCLWRQM